MFRVLTDAINALESTHELDTIYFELFNDLKLSAISCYFISVYAGLESVVSFNILYIFDSSRYI